jgi:hypothetical protein
MIEITTTKKKGVHYSTYSMKHNDELGYVALAKPAATGHRENIKGMKIVFLAVIAYLIIVVCRASALLARIMNHLAWPIG